MLTATVKNDFDGFALWINQNLVDFIQDNHSRKKISEMLDLAPESFNDFNACYFVSKEMGNVPMFLKDLSVVANPEEYLAIAIKNGQTQTFGTLEIDKDDITSLEELQNLIENDSQLSQNTKNILADILTDAQQNHTQSCSMGM